MKTRKWACPSSCLRDRYGHQISARGNTPHLEMDLTQNFDATWYQSYTLSWRHPVNNILSRGAETYSKTPTQEHHTSNCRQVWITWMHIVWYTTAYKAACRGCLPKEAKMGHCWRMCVTRANNERKQSGLWSFKLKNVLSHIKSLRYTLLAAQ